MVSSLLAELRERDVRLWADGDRLRCTAPIGVLTPELREQLRHRKTEILELLRSSEMLSQQQRAIVPLQPKGQRTPVFAVAGHNGDVFCYRTLSQHLGNDQPFYGLQPLGLDEGTEPLRSVEQLAAHFASQIRAFRQEGELVIAGYCAGGTIAFEVAQQLVRAGAQVSSIALFASPYPSWYRLLPQAEHQIQRMKRHLTALLTASNSERRTYVSERLRARKMSAPDVSDPVLARRGHVERVTLRAVRQYNPQQFPGRVNLFLPGKQWLRTALLGWRGVSPQIREFAAPDDCPGDRLLLEPYAPAVADLFRLSLTE